MDFEQNLDDLFTYTQGLIQELRQKGQPASRNEYSRAHASPMLNSLRKAREDSLQRRAMQKKRQNPSQENSLEENIMRMNDLEEQWVNQKNESTYGPSNSFTMNTKQYKNKDPTSTNIYTPYKTSPWKVDRDDTDFLAAPIDDFSDQSRTYYHPSRHEINQQPKKSYNAADKLKLASKNYILNQICQRRNSDSYDNKNPVSKTKKSTLKPSRSMTDIKIRSSKPTDISFTCKSKKVPVLKEIQLFLENHNLLSAVNASTSKSKLTKSKSRERLSKANERVLENSFEGRDRLGRRPSERGPNCSLVDITPPVETIPNNYTLNGEISIIEPKEVFEFDLDFAGTNGKLFSKRSSFANDTWLHNAEGTDKFKSSLGRNKKGFNSHLRTGFSYNLPINSSLKTDQYSKQGNNNRNIPSRVQTPLKAVNLNHKQNSSTAVLNSDSKQSNKTPRKSVPRGVKNTQMQKENENNPRSVYDQIMLKSYTKQKYPSDYDKKMTPVDKKRSSSTKRSESRGRIEGRLDMSRANNGQRASREPNNTSNNAPTNEVDRLYKEIMDKLTKERALMAQ